MTLKSCFLTHSFINKQQLYPYSLTLFAHRSTRIISVHLQQYIYIYCPHPAPRRCCRRPESALVGSQCLFVSSCGVGNMYRERERAGSGSSNTRCVRAHLTATALSGTQPPAWTNPHPIHTTQLQQCHTGTLPYSAQTIHCSCTSEVITVK